MIEFIAFLLMMVLVMLLGYLFVTITLKIYLFPRYIKFVLFEPLPVVKQELINMIIYPYLWPYHLYNYWKAKKRLKNR